MRGQITQHRPPATSNDVTNQSQRTDPRRCRTTEAWESLLKDVLARDGFAHCRALGSRAIQQGTSHSTKLLAGSCRPKLDKLRREISFRSDECFYTRSRTCSMELHATGSRHEDAQANLLARFLQEIPRVVLGSRLIHDPSPRTFRCLADIGIDECWIAQGAPQEGIRVREASAKLSVVERICAIWVCCNGTRGDEKVTRCCIPS